MAQQPLIVTKAERMEDGNLKFFVKSPLVEAHWKSIEATPSLPAKDGGPKGYDCAKLRKQQQLVGSMTEGWNYWISYPYDYIQAILLAEGLGDGITIMLSGRDTLWTDDLIKSLQARVCDHAVKIYANLCQPYKREQSVMLEVEEPNLPATED
jgi:hypothetical protein